MALPLDADDVLRRVNPDMSALDPAHDALNRMARAHQRGTGCHLTADQIRALSLTTIGSLWSQPDPRKEEETK